MAPSGHQGAVTALIDDDRGRLLSAGADGYLEVWDTRYDAAVRRLQLSQRPILGMALRPGASEIGVVESDDIGVYRVSAWDYETGERRFTCTFRDTVSYVTYSAAGTYLIAVRSGRAAAVFIHAETGAILRTLDTAGAVSFAATGKSERTMITYLPAGVLSYWDLESGQEIGHFAVPPRMESVLLFGNNRFLAGIDRSGMVILNAVSGAVLIRERLVMQGFLMPVRSEAPEFLGLSAGAYTATLYHFGLTNTGRLGVQSSWAVPGTVPRVTSAALTPDAVVLGTADGDVWVGRNGGAVKRMTVSAKVQRPIAEAAVSGDALGFLTRDYRLGFIPLDYRSLAAQALPLEAVPYTRITAGPSSAGGDQFILWQSEHTRSPPVLRMPGYEDVPITTLGLRFPLRSVALFEDRALFLDSLGNIKVISLRTRGQVFGSSFVAALDAVFLSYDTILIGRAAVSGNTPFLRVNIATGETVPLAYPASAGARVYRGAEGACYAAVIAEEDGIPQTALLRLSTANPAQTARLFEWEGEDTGFGLADAGGSAVSSLGGFGAFFYDGVGAPRPLARSAGFPLQLINAGAYLIAVDAEGSLIWHDPQTGEVRATLRLYEDGAWLLQTRDSWGGRILSGTVED